MIRLLALGVRLSWGAGRAGRVRVGLMALGSTVAAFVVLTSVALTGMADRQQQREVSIAPRQANTATSLRGAVIADGWNGRELRRVVLAVTGPAAPVPPGLDRVPKPGEVALSPALDRLADTEPLIARRFPQRRVATIDNDGLVEPGQLLAYVGLRESQLTPQAAGIAGFGDPMAARNLDPRTARTVSLLILLTLVAPVVMFMVTCARLSATSRSQRLAALRMMGLSPGRTHTVNAAETGIVSVAGSIVGLLMWQSWRRIASSVTVGSFGWYSTDLRLQALPTILTLAGLVAVAVTVGAAGGRPAVVAPLRVRRERSIRRVSGWRALPLATGIGLLVLSWLTSGASSDRFLAWMLPFGAGLLLTAVGLVIVVPAAAKGIGALLHRSARPAALLAGARLQHEPAVAARVLASMAVALFAAGFSQVVLTAVNTTYAGSNETQLDDVVNLTVWGPEADAADYQPISDLGVALPQWQLGTAGIDAIAATCAQLRLAAAAPLPDCHDGRIYSGRSARLPDYRADPTTVDAALEETGLPPTSGELMFELLGPDSSLYVPAVIIPPELAPASTTRFNVAFSRDAYDGQRVTAELVERAPAAFWSPMITAVDRLDGVRIYSGIVAVGTLAALTVGLAALVVATVDRAIERRNALAHLAALGAPIRTVRAALALQTLPVALLVLIASGAAATIGGSSYLRWGDPSIRPPFGALTFLTALAIGAAVVATLAALAGTAARPRSELLRQE